MSIEAGEYDPAERKRLWWLVLFALALRLAMLTIGHTYRFPTIKDHFSFGWETGRLARSIASGEGFSSPFDDHTGPSAWVAPLYPYFLAGVFKLFGIYTNTSAWIALAVNCIFSALTCIPIYFIGKELFGIKVAKWTAWLWALAPFSIYWAIRFAWETSFATMLFAFAFLLAVRMEQQNRLSRWLWFAFVWGLIALSNPSLLTFLPFAGFWVLYRQHRRGDMKFRWAFYSGLLFCAMIAPWMVRDYVVFHKLILIRGNFGVELRLGNGPKADGQLKAYLHPTQDPLEFERYRTMGEVTYAKMRGQQAMEWIKQNPGRFAEISLIRFYYYWCGTPRAVPDLEAVLRYMLVTLSSALTFFGLGHALRRHNRGAFLFVWMFLTVPTIYYFTYTHPRYRHPIEPEMLVLMVFLFTQLQPKRSAISASETS
ncbi:MAG TPA: glycosyltransferase family 39 protein [Terriglobales bacterium]|nr:glycosyltransferase family 39 protein [Terriglobales bacterium]